MNKSVTQLIRDSEQAIRFVKNRNDFEHDRIPLNHKGF